MASRDDMVNDPRSGARPLGGSEGGSGETRRYPRYSRSSSLPRDRSPRPAPPPRGSTLSSEAVAQRRAAVSASPRTSGSRGTETSSAAGPRRPAAAAERGTPRSRRSSPARQVRRQYNAHVTTNYERVIVAEFVIAVLLVAVAPFTRKAKSGISPYYGQDMVQIVAIMAAYFILGLVAQAGGSTARISAWFGGLLLLGIGLGEAAYLAKEFQLFGASTSSPSNTSNPDAAVVGTNVTPPPPPVPEGSLNG